MAFAATRTEGAQMQTLLARLLGGGGGGGGGGGTAEDAPAALSDAQRIELLTDIEFHVASVHNAGDFNTMGGLTAVVLMLNGGWGRGQWTRGGGSRGGQRVRGQGQVRSERRCCLLRCRALQPRPCGL